MSYFFPLDIYIHKLAANRKAVRTWKHQGIYVRGKCIQQVMSGEGSGLTYWIHWIQLGSFHRPPSKGNVKKLCSVCMLRQTKAPAELSATRVWSHLCQRQRGVSLVITGFTYISNVLQAFSCIIWKSPTIWKDVNQEKTDLVESSKAWCYQSFLTVALYIMDSISRYSLSDYLYK